MVDQLKEAYIRKIEDIGPIAVWLVDGSKVRAYNNEFTNYAHHYTFAFIPENEFWLDQEAAHDERQFFIDHMLAEYHACKNGKTFGEALAIADKKERAERIKAGDLSKVMDKEGHPEIQSVYKEQLGKTKSDVFVWIVSGRLVRSVFFMEYVQGGHDFVYKFIPHNEVWLDDDLVLLERPFVLIHELHERNLMKRGSSYLPAHKSASELEWHLRHKPENLLKALLELGVDDKKLLAGLGINI